MTDTARVVARTRRFGGRKPSKNLSFLVLVAGKAGNKHQNMKTRERLRLSRTLTA
jgi:hypothetical protein